MRRRCSSYTKPEFDSQHQKKKKEKRRAEKAREDMSKAQETKDPGMLAICLER
jgi:hypothetical protein